MLAHAAREVAEEGLARGGDGPKGGDGEKAEAEVGREGHRLGAIHTVLGAARSADGGRVGGEALTVRVMRLDVGGGGNVERLDLNHGPDARRIEAKDHDVRRVMEEGTRPVHPHPHTPPRVPTRPTEVGDDAVGAEDGLQDGGESLHHRVVDGPRKARAVAADGVVTRAEGGEGGVTDVPGAGATDNGPVGRRVSRGRDEEQIKGEGGDEVGRRAESEKGLAGAGGDGGDGDPAPEGEGATGDAAVEEARTAGGEGCLVEGEELVRRDHCRGGALRVWVASQVTRVQVHKGEGGLVLRVLVTVGLLTKNDRGGGETPVEESGVHGRKPGVGGEEVVGAKGGGIAVGGHDAVAGGRHRPAVREAAARPNLRKLRAIERGQPS